MDTISSRISYSFNLLKNNFLSYFLINIAIFSIYMLLFFLIGFVGLSSSAFDYFISIFNHGSDYRLFNFGFVFISIIIFLLLWRWAFGSSLYIGNFYLTKSISENNKLPFTKLLELSFKKLWDKAKLDFWYFILVVLPVLLIILLYIIVLSNLNISASFLTFLLVLSVLFLGIRLFLQYFFSYYYCFDNDKFSFQDFKNSANISKGKLLNIFGNILLLGVLYFVIYISFSFLFGPFVNSDNFIFVFLVFALQIFIVFCFNVFNFIYFFAYYKNSLGNKTNENKLDNVEKKNTNIEY